MPPPVPVSPYGFDFARQAWFDGLGGLGFSFGRIDIIDDTPTGGLAMRASIKVAAFRNRVSQHIRTKLEGDTGAMAAALITGDRSGVPPGHTDALRDASLAHLLAISGLHMGIAGWTLYGLVRFLLSLSQTLALRLPIKKIAAAAGLSGAAFYLILSGASISSQRAFIMIALMLTAIMVDRPAFTLRNVALAATLILILQPESLMQAGSKCLLLPVLHLFRLTRPSAIGKPGGSPKAKG